MAHVFAVVNQKGGVGKTTTAINVATELARAGTRVLLVDCDPQANATSGVGVKAVEPTIYNVLLDNLPAEKTLRLTSIPNLQLVPSEADLAGADIELLSIPEREYLLKRALESVQARFDFILIDAPPSMGLLTVNALVAADSALVPIQCEYYALEGVSQLVRTVELIRTRLNPSLQIGLIVLTMFDTRLRLNWQVANEVRKAFGSRVAKAVIPRSVRFAEAPSHGIPATLFDPRSKGAEAYRDIAQEVLKYAETRPGSRP